jgi:hypothetical protein
MTAAGRIIKSPEDYRPVGLNSPFRFPLPKPLQGSGSESGKSFKNLAPHNIGKRDHAHQDAGRGDRASDHPSLQSRRRAFEVDT